MNRVQTTVDGNFLRAGNFYEFDECQKFVKIKICKIYKQTSTTNEELNSFTPQEKGWSHFFGGTELLISKN